MTPIEFAAWISIRAKGRIVLYPQYPALNYHLDFGNPGFKIGLEIDGKNFHSYERDFNRDKALYEAGWKIYRITGSEMVKSDFVNLNDIRQAYDMPERDADEYLEDWLMNTGDGVIEAIKFVHFESSIDQEFSSEPIFSDFSNYCYKTLQKHTYHE
jgi:very-short-patch-repair endonuclease